MRHQWDYSQYGKDPRDILCRGRRVCRICGTVQRRHARQFWMRVVGYGWDGDGRGKCPGPPNKKKDS